jgi:hypothetical protein
MPTPTAAPPGTTSSTKAGAGGGPHVPIGPGPAALFTTEADDGSYTPYQSVGTTAKKAVAIDGAGSATSSSLTPSQNEWMACDIDTEFSLRYEEMDIAVQMEQLNDMKKNRGAGGLFLSFFG